MLGGHSISSRTLSYWDLKTFITLGYYCFYKVFESEGLEKLKINTKDLFYFQEKKMFRNFKPKYCVVLEIAMKEASKKEVPHNKGTRKEIRTHINTYIIFFLAHQKRRMR